MGKLRYSQEAEKILALAKKLAEDLGSEYYGVSHVTVAILINGKGFGFDALVHIGFSIAEIYEELYQEATADLEVSKEEQETIIKEAEASVLFCGDDCDYVASEHILMGLLALEKGAMYESIARAEVGIENFIKYLSGDIDEIKLVEEEEVMKPANLASLTATESVLNTYGVDLVEKYITGEADPIIGREDEADKCIRTLCRRLKSNPILVGEAGVGKTAIAQCIAQRIAHGKVPEELKDKRLIVLDVLGMLGGTKYRGQFEDKIKNLLKEVKERGNIIIFIDEIHTIVGAGASNSEESGDLSDILKPALARGDLSCVGATTKKEYEKYIVADNALDRRFQRILVEENTPQDTVKILKGLKATYERHHNVTISDSSIKHIVEKCKAISDRKFPDKAIDLLDDSCTEAKLGSKKEIPEDMKEKETELTTLEGLAGYCGKTEEENHFFYQKLILKENVRKMTEVPLRKKHIDIVIKGMDIKSTKRMGF